MTKIIGLALAALAFALLLSAGPAQAQTIPFALPACAPEAIGGAGKGLRIFSGMYGKCHGWWCPAGAGWESYTHCHLTGVPTPETTAENDAGLTAAKTPLDALQWLMYATQVTPTGPQADQYNALHVAAKADLLASKPVSLWAVDSATSADGTRPAFALTNGVRAEISTARAKSGQPCKPEVAQTPSQVSGKVFAAFGPNFAPGMVALCRKG